MICIPAHSAFKTNYCICMCAFTPLCVNACTYKMTENINLKSPPFVMTSANFSSDWESSDGSFKQMERQLFVYAFSQKN